jgi:acyl-CoA synthetase (AMP-forming)/AMP-acid ligase II
MIMIMIMPPIQLNPLTDIISLQPPLLTHTIPSHFSQIVAAHGDRPAVISRAQGERLTYRELDERSNALARGLRERGVRKGDRVAVSLGNNWEYAVTNYALYKMGAILVPLNPAFNSPQVISALSHLSSAHLIIGAETNLAYKPPRENVTLLREIVGDLSSSRVRSEVVPSLRNVIVVNNSGGRIDMASFTATTQFTDLVKGSESEKAKTLAPDEPLDKDDIINIQFTSGTTGAPKAACLTHESILNNGYFIGERMQLTAEDIVCCPPPLFHCFGLILGYMATATHGSAIVFPSEAFNPESSLRAVQEERATALYGVPTMFIAELELLATGAVPYEGFERLRTGIAAGSSVPSNLMDKLHRILNLTGLTICYGMTETSPVSIMTTPDDPLEKRLDTVGRLMPHTEARIVSPTDPTHVLPRGQRGELVVSGYLVMKGYWDDEGRTAEVRSVERVEGEDGKITEKAWMRTGDEAEMDEDGYVRITGRIKDLIIRGGENIHPLEIENVLLQHDLVSDVSVVGLPDERHGECVAAFVIPRKEVRVGGDDAGGGDKSVDIAAAGGEKQAQSQTLTKEDIRHWVRTRLSNHLVPKYVFWVDDYPKTASGKIQKFTLKEKGIRLLKGMEGMKG